ncbi:fumarylacetoacetate hydrolase family protein [Emergencia sp.]|uniref:fumarylacetoacetate hydrolase family protein n=1 Tax=Emergencia sp. TaxID=1926557 RepID=UPI003AF1A10B
MKLATIRYQDNVYAGLVKDGNFYSFQGIDETLPNDMIEFIEKYETCKTIICEKLEQSTPTCAASEAKFLSPIPRPRTFRDFMSFEEHVVNSGAAAGFDDTTMKNMLAVWRRLPAFYFSNTNVFFGPDEPIKMHPHSQRFDMEFEIAVVIGKEGINVPKEEAADYIFGMTILNDWSARDIQMEEMQMQLGPAKGKDYANSMGPVIVTMDELQKYALPDDPSKYDMATKLYRNGELIRENNTKSIYHTYCDLIAYSSRETKIYPGDVLGSGTIGGGAMLEYMGRQPFVHAGDKIDMEVEGIGTLKMSVV